MDDDRKTNVASIPTWDGAEATCPSYIAKIEALAIYQQCKDALDENEMGNCPTKLAYNGINKVTTDNDKKRMLSLYMQNAKRVTTIVLGQAINHGLTVVQKTKTTDNPSGFAWKSIDAMKKKSKPSNTTAEVTLNEDLDNIKFTSAKKYYNDVIAVTARYDVPASETGLKQEVLEKGRQCGIRNGYHRPLQWHE